MSTIYEVKFDINKTKAAVIATKLYHDFYSRKGFFQDYEMPEYIAPDNLVEGSKEHAWYLTLVISIDYMTDAVKLWRNARETYRLHPDKFNPNVILNLGTRTLTSLVRDLGARYPKSAAETWKKVCRTIVEKYDGDPRNITPKPSTIRQVNARLNDFPYLRGNKLSNFYLRAMGEKGLLNISNLPELNIPVDIQVARFTAYTGTLRPLSDSFQGCVHKDPLRSLIEQTWRDAAKEIGTYPWKLDEPIWTIGSKLCAKRICHRCPVEDLCEKVKGIKLKGALMIWERLST